MVDASLAGLALGEAIIIPSRARTLRTGKRQKKQDALPRPICTAACGGAVHSKRLIRRIVWQRWSGLPFQIDTEKSTCVYKSTPPGRKTDYGDNWRFIIPGWDLQEDTCTRWRLFVRRARTIGHHDEDLKTGE
jgi:hypothetical protein